MGHMAHGQNVSKFDPTLNPQEPGTAFRLSFTLSSALRLALVGIALRVTEAHKPAHHVKVATHLGGTQSHLFS